MNVLEEAGFSFDMGPTIITMPQVLRGIIERCGRRPEDAIELVRLNPQWRCFYEDGVRIDLLDGEEAMAAAIEDRFPGEGRGWREFMAHSRRMFRLSEDVFFYKDLGGVQDLIRKPPPRRKGILGDVLAMRMHSTMAATVHRHLREPHLRQMAEHFLQYVGSSPFLAPAILSLIAAAQADHGCWYAMGGTRQVARTLARLADELGVEIRLSTGVAEILIDSQARGERRVSGVRTTTGETLAADVVISNCDVQRTMRDLVADGLGRAEQRAIASAYTPACSGVVFYFGLDRQYEQLAHHCFLFSRDSQEEFDDIYAKGIPARDPTIYLAVPSRTDPDQAPPGCEALYALIHTPYLRPGQRWEGPGGLLESYRRVVVAKLTRMGLVDLEKHIVLERTLTPQGIEARYAAEGGAIYGLASHGRLRGGFKPRNRSRVAKGLYLAGGSVNPGPGVPMVLMSGVTAANAVAEDWGLADERVEASEMVGAMA